MNGFVLTNPVGLWALAAVAVAAILYLFYRRHRLQKVTGLFLWGIPRRESAGGRKIEKPLLGRSFLLDLAAAGLLGLALAGPAWRTDVGLPVAIILDDAFSMRSRDAHMTAAKLAEDLASEADGRGVEAAILLAGENPSVLRGPGRYARGETAALLRDYLPAAKETDIPAAVLLAQKLYGPSLEIHIVTNQNAEPTVGGVNPATVHVLPGNGGNLAFAQAWREPDASPLRERLTLSVVNYSESAANAALVVAAGAETVHAEEFRLGPGETRFFDVSLSLVGDETLDVSLSGTAETDVIAADSSIRIPPARTRAVTYLVEGLHPDASRYFTLALEAAGCVPAPWDQEGVPPPDILVTSGGAASGGVVTLEVPPVIDPGVYTPPFVVDTASPLCRDLSLSAVPWTIARREAPLNVAQAYVLAGDTPLYWRDASGRLHLNLAVERSLIVNDPAWPVMMSNLATTAQANLPGLGAAAYRPGDVLRYRPEAGRGRTGLVFEGEGRRFPAFHGREARVPRNPGLYLLRDDAGEIGPVAVLPLFGTASDASRLATAERTLHARGDGETAGGGARDLTWLALTLGLLLLGLNWRLLAKGEE